MRLRSLLLLIAGFAVVVSTALLLTNNRTQPVSQVEPAAGGPAVTAVSSPPQPPGTEIATEEPTSGLAEAGVESPVAPTWNAYEQLARTPGLTITLETLPTGAQVESVLEGLNEPVALALDRAGRIFYIERPGAVRLAVDGVVRPEPVIVINVETCWERGLVGITLDPEFESNRYVYVSYGEKVACTETHSKVARFVEKDGKGSDLQELFKSPLSGELHTGNNIHFGPDGKLYISVGDNYKPENGQDATAPQGKIHRINPDGTIPPDNPVFTQTGALPSLYAMGLRNSFDFAFDPVVQGRIFASENGTDCNDEMNRIEAGYNYGWRAGYPCDDAAPDLAYNTIPPMWYMAKGECCVGPTGVEVYRGTTIPEWSNQLFMCSYNQGAMLHFYLNEDRTRVEKVARVEGVKCTMGITTGPDGALYYIEGGGGGPGAIKRIVVPGG